MARKYKIVVTLAIGLAITIGLLLSPGFIWSARCQYMTKRLIMRAGLHIANWRGQQPRTVLLQGHLIGTGAFAAARIGAQVSLLESSSGYAALTDNQGNFLLPHVIWYPNAVYHLVIRADDQHLQAITVTAPQQFPANGHIDAGEIDLTNCAPISPAQLLTRNLRYDYHNHDFYRALFDQLTQQLHTDEARIDAINRYVATKLNYQDTTFTFDNPRQILTRGNCYCSNLALAMAAITAAGNYPTRTVHLTDSPEHRNTHVVTEIYYGDQWHLYDPTYGICFRNRAGVVASYQELRLQPALITTAAMAQLDKKVVEGIMTWMPAAFNSGFHQLYQVDKN